MARRASSHGISPEVGRVGGKLALGEDIAALEAALRHGPAWAERGEVTLLNHADHSHPPSLLARDAEAHRAMERLSRGALARYVFAMPTAAGARVVKIHEITTWRDAAAGLWGASAGQREHVHGVAAEARELAAAPSRGWLEWRRGPALVRSCQVQLPLGPQAVPFERFLHEELDRFGDAALDSFAMALAATHTAGFFHGDLRGFHAYVIERRRSQFRPTTYRLQWIDLTDASFKLTLRRRIINLVQALRYVVPDRDDAQRHFIRAYCNAAGWCWDDPAGALKRVQRLLAADRRARPAP